MSNDIAPKFFATLTLSTILTLAGCGGKNTGDSVTDLAPPPDAATEVAPEPSHDMGLNTAVSMADEIEAAWSGATVRVIGPDGVPILHELPIGEETVLGDTGLAVTALVFIPDFVMDDTGITSRSTEHNNPALRVRVTEAGEPYWEGWLFAALPDIHPFPHDSYEILLVEGVPAD